MAVPSSASAARMDCSHSPRPISARACTANHEVAIQAGGWGHYAKVELELEVRGGGRGLRVTYAQLDQPWRAGAAFGVAYAFERSG